MGRWLKLLPLWCYDYLFLVRGTLLMLRYRRPPARDPRNATAGTVPVVLIPGVAETWAFLKPLADELSRAGHAVYTVPRLGWNRTSIASGARLVRDVIDENDLHHVVLVAHSKGGLVGKAVLLHHNDDGRIDAVIAIAVPWGGSTLARVVPSPSYRELIPTAPVVRALLDLPHVNGRIVSINPSFDNHVWPQESCTLVGATNIGTPVKGHHRIVFDRGVRALVLQRLAEVTRDAAGSPAERDERRELSGMLR